MLADAKKYLIKNNIPLNDVIFVKICEMLQDPKYTRYCYLFTYLAYETKTSKDIVQDIAALYNKIVSLKDNVKKLPKDILTYRYIDQLLDDISILQTNVLNKKFINLLPEYLSRTVELKLSDGKTKTKTFNDSVVRFFQLPIEFQKDFSKNVSRIRSFSELASSLRTFCSLVKKGKDFESLKKKCQNMFGVNLLHSDDTYILVEVTEYETLKKLGTTSWCIARETSHYISYVHEQSNSSIASQYILWNNKLSTVDPMSQIAFTLNRDTNILAHNRRNDAINLNNYLKQHGLESVHLYLKNKTIEEKIDDYINAISHISAKKRVPNWYNSRLRGNAVNGRLPFIDVDKLAELCEKYDVQDIVATLKSLDGPIITNVKFLYSLYDKMKTRDDYWKRVIKSFYHGGIDSLRYSVILEKMLNLFLNRKHTASSVDMFFKEMSILSYSLTKLIKAEDLVRFAELNISSLSYNRLLDIYRKVNNNSMTKSILLKCMTFDEYRDRDFYQYYTSQELRKIKEAELVNA